MLHGKKSTALSLETMPVELAVKPKQPKSLPEKTLHSKPPNLKLKKLKKDGSAVRANKEFLNGSAALAKDTH